MNFHEAAELFPMDEERLEELARDIKQNGQLVPIELCDGKIIDGRRRFRACEIAGVEPKTREVRPADPVAYSLSLNLQRRHLNSSQRAMIGGRLRAVFDREAKERQQTHGHTSPGNAKDTCGNISTSVSGSARDRAGEAVGVSGKLIDSATKVLEHGTPEVVSAVDQGRMKVTVAARLIKDPPDVQKEMAGIAGNGRVRRQTRKPTASAHPTQESELEPLEVGVIRANEAIDCLKRIPSDDALRSQGLQIVKDWIGANP